MTDAQHEALLLGEQILKVLFDGAAGPSERSDVLCGEEICPVTPPDLATQIDGPESRLTFQLVDIPIHRANG